MPYANSSTATTSSNPAPHRKNAAQRNRSDSPYQERTSQKDNPTQLLIKQAVDYLIEQLEAGKSETLTAYLTAMARFHPYQPRRSVAPRQSLRRSMLPSPEMWRLGLRACPFEAILVHLRYGPATRSPSLKMASSIRFRTESFLTALLFKLRGLDFYPGGTCSH